MATNALGPTMAGGNQPIVEDGYELIYYPDVNNDLLQREGKPPVFYYLPNYVHLARKDGKENGPLMFNLIRFAGVQSGETTVGVADGTKREVAGGVLSFTVTAAPPDNVLKKSQEKITQMFQGKTDFFWGIRSQQPPIFRPVIITSNLTAVSNVSPIATGEVVTSTPTVTPATAGGQANADAPQATPPGVGGRELTFKGHNVPALYTSKDYNSVQQSRDGSNLNEWYWNMQGQGNGSIDPMGQSAYSALIGSYPASILWGSFHGNYSPIFVQQRLKVKFWVPTIEITIRGNWEKVFTHFSGAANARYLWFSADLKAEFNNMRINGTIDVDIKMDSTIPGGENIERFVNERTDLVFNKFMEEAKKVIFDPPQPEVAPAQAPSGGIFGIWGAGLAIKYRRDETHLDLYYHESRQMAYLQDHTISSSLEGMAEELKAKPENEKLYFQTIYLDDWPRKLGRIVKPVVNWPSIGSNFTGAPVAFVATQIGYPNTAGEKMWVGKTFQKSDPSDTSWNLTMTQKSEADMTKIPPNWTPDKTYIKRTVHFLEAPDTFDNPFVNVQIQDNQINIDPPEGTLSDTVAIEVRADDVSRIKVGPINLNIELENNKQIVEVSFRALDADNKVITSVNVIKFGFNNENQTAPRFWSVYSSNINIQARFEYQVRVIVKGSIMTKGMEWKGPWLRSVGNGPLMITVPTPEDEGVTTVRSYLGRPTISIDEANQPNPNLSTNPNLNTDSGGQPKQLSNFKDVSESRAYKDLSED